MALFGESKVERTERELRQAIEILQQENEKLLAAINEKDGIITKGQAYNRDNKVKLAGLEKSNAELTEANKILSEQKAGLEQKLSEQDAQLWDKQIELEELLQKYAHILAEKTRKTNRDAKKINELKEKLNRLQDSYATA